LKCADGTDSVCVIALLTVSAGSFGMCQWPLAYYCWMCRSAINKIHQEICNRNGQFTWSLITVSIRYSDFIIGRYHVSCFSGTVSGENIAQPQTVNNKENELGDIEACKANQARVILNGYFLRHFLLYDDVRRKVGKGECFLLFAI